MRVEDVARRIHCCGTVAILIYPFPSEMRLESLELILPDAEILHISISCETLGLTQSSYGFLENTGPTLQNPSSDRRFNDHREMTEPVHCQRNVIRHQSTFEIRSLLSVAFSAQGSLIGLFEYPSRQPHSATSTNKNSGSAAACRALLWEGHQPVALLESQLQYYLTPHFCYPASCPRLIRTALPEKRCNRSVWHER